MSQKNTPSILSLQLSEILVTLKPFIHAFIVLTRVLQWKPINDNDNNNSNKTNPMILIVLLWTILCFHHKFLLGIVIPSIIITILVTGLLPKVITMVTTTTAATTTKTRFGARRSSCSTDQNLEDDDPIMNEIIQELAELTTLLTRLFNMTHDDDSSFHEKKKKKNTNNNNNNNNNIMVVDHENIIVGTCLMIFWQWILHTSRLCYVVWFTGCLLLTWWSPWVHMLRHMIQQKKGAVLASVANVFNAVTTTSTTTMKKTTPFNTTENNIVVKQELDRFYCFSIYEHQRWWLHRGWSKSLLPHDRPEWSDEYLEPTPSIDAFNLPPPSHSSHWVWVDPSWCIDKNGVKDDNGWEYGNWDWKSWSNKSTGLSILTRRRRWVRCARRIEEESRIINEQCDENDNENENEDTAESIASSYSSTLPDTTTTAAGAAETIQAALLSSSPKSTTASSFSGCSSPSLVFSPKPRPTSLLTHRTLSSITTISSSSSASLATSYGSLSSSPTTATTMAYSTAKADCGTHFWLHR